jgi:hypothetical protein
MISGLAAVIASLGFRVAERVEGFLNFAIHRLTACRRSLKAAAMACRAADLWACSERHAIHRGPLHPGHQRRRNAVLPAAISSRQHA